ncbi:hypothetical protein Tco_0280548 [Tanacetum coccineum]
MRTKPRVDSLSFDDLYNNLRVFEYDVKGSTASSFNTQNVVFVSENTNSTNDVSTAYGVSIFFGPNSQNEHHLHISLLANQSSYPQLDHEDLEQLDESKGNQDSKRRENWNTGNKDKENGRRSSKQEDSKALVTLDGEGIDWTSYSEDEQENYALMALQHQMSAKDKAGLGYGDQMNKSVLSYENEVFQSVFVSRTSDIEDSPVNDRYAEGMHAVPPPNRQGSTSLLDLIKK